MPIDFRGLPLLVNVAIFSAAAVAVWIAGSRLAGYADVIANRTKFSRAFVGVVLLGVTTSLPEVATTITGSLLGNARLVSGNLFGGVALQIAVLALVDAIAVRGALTYFAPHPVLLFQGVMLILLLAIALAGAALGDPLAIAGLGVTPLLLGAGYLLMVRLSQGGDVLPRWHATDAPEREKPMAADDDRNDASLSRLGWLSAASAAVILVAGWALASTGDALAEQTALGASFIGVTLVAASTSLPELSTTLGAVRRGNHEMAVSNILGTNCLEVALFLVADIAYRGGPILAETDRSAYFAAAVGMLVTSIFVVGLLERRNKTILRMGLDSIAVLLVYAVGLVGLYTLR